MKPLNVLLFIAILALMQGCYKEPVANFEYSYADHLAPASITFTNTSVDADKYQWNFGDGNLSGDENPVHFFNEYVGPSVSLMATGRGGDNTISKTLDITSYFIRNSFSSALYDVMPFFWDEDKGEILDDFNLGYLNSGYDTQDVITVHTTIHVSFDLSDGTTYLTDPAYNLIEHKNSYININDETTVVEVPSSKKGTMSQINIPEILANGTKVQLKDLLSR